MTCFFFGALSVFDREIDRWAIPETRYEAQPMPSFDSMLLPIFRSSRPSEQSYDLAQWEVAAEVKGQLHSLEAMRASDVAA